MTYIINLVKGKLKNNIELMAYKKIHKKNPVASFSFAGLIRH